MRISFRNEDKSGNIKNIRIIFWIQLVDLIMLSCRRVIVIYFENQWRSL